MDRYELRFVELPELVAEIDRLWSRLATDPSLQEDIHDAGIDVSQLTHLPRPHVIDLTTPTHGITGAEFMDVGFVSVLAGAQLAARDLWKRIILPRLQKRFGKGSVKPKVAERPQSAPTTTVRTKPRQQKDAGAGRAAAKQKDKGPAKKAGKKAAPKRVPAKAKKRR